MSWVAGWNMPGYLPECEPVSFDTWREAHAYIVEELERAWDYSGTDDDYLEAHTEMHLASEGEPYWVSVEGDRVRYWVEIDREARA